MNLAVWDKIYLIWFDLITLSDMNDQLSIQISQSNAATSEWRSKRILLKLIHILPKLSQKRLRGCFYDLNKIISSKAMAEAYNNTYALSIKARA